MKPFIRKLYDKYTRKELLHVISDFVSQGPLNEESWKQCIGTKQAAIQQIRKSIIDSEPFMQPGVLSLENVIEYLFRNPFIACKSLCHTSTPKESFKKHSAYFQTMENVGDTVLQRIVAAHFSYTHQFPPKITDIIIESVVSNDYLARLFVKWGLVGIASHGFDEMAYKSFATSVVDGEYVTPPTKCYADMVEAIIGAMFQDCGDFDLCYQTFIGMLWIEENPTFKLFREYTGSTYPKVLTLGKGIHQVRLGANVLSMGTNLLATHHKAFEKTIQMQGEKMK